MSTSLIQLILAMIRVNPKERASSEQIMSYLKLTPSFLEAMNDDDVTVSTAATTTTVTKTPISDISEETMTPKTPKLSSPPKKIKLLPKSSNPYSPKTPKGPKRTLGHRFSDRFSGTHRRSLTDL